MREGVWEIKSNQGAVHDEFASEIVKLIPDT